MIATRSGRRLSIMMFLLVSSVSVLAADISISTGIGVNFFRAERPYLTALSVTYQPVIAEGLELNIGSEFAITTEGDGGQTNPNILLPFNIGLNFTFPQEASTFLFGVGITPVFSFMPEDDNFQFYMGPYVKGALQVRVHPIMSWFMEAKQDLLIGGPEWINSSTRLLTGINFSYRTRPW